MPPGRSAGWSARSSAADARARRSGWRELRCASRVNVQLRLAGRHNAANALGVAGAALALGVAPDVPSRRPWVRSSGVGRRLERKGEGRGVVVYDDYGHHPTAIRETLAAIRQLEPGRRIWAVYEPLTYHRTAAMLDEFADVLATADAVAIADDLGQPRSRHDDHLGRGAGRGHGPPAPGMTAGGSRVRGGDGRLAGGCRSSPATRSW